MTPVATTALTLTEQATNLQMDVKEQLEAFFASLLDLNSAISMSDALVAQSRAITVFKRDGRGAIIVSDADAFVKASEQVAALNSVIDEIEGLYEPFAAALFKAHRTVTGLRAANLLGATGEVKRLKGEREAFAAEEERKRRKAAQKAQEEARQREESRLIEEARLAAAEGKSDVAEAILEEAVNVEAPAVVLPSTVPQVAGVSFRSVWGWTLNDVTKLKPEFLTPKDKEIGALVRSMYKTAETLVGAGAISVNERRVPVDR